MSILGPAKPDRLVEVRVPGTEEHTRFLEVGDLGVIDPSSDLGHDWYFGVCLRSVRGSHEPVAATVAWCDVDHPKAGFDPLGLLPVPGVVVSSGGGGYHMYWPLDREVPPGRALNLSKLARVSFGGDPKVLEVKRMMRVPGSENQKYDPPRPCSVVGGGGAQFDPDRLEEVLFASVVRTVYERGNRHSLALGSAALLVRAGWPLERVENAVRALCRYSGDEQVSDRLQAARGTVARGEAGSAVAVGELRDALGKSYHEVVDALGITSRDGDVLEGGVKVGEVTTLERDFVELVARGGQWASVDGIVARWVGDCWRDSTQDELTSSVFARSAGMTVVENGVEIEFCPSAKLSGQVARILAGRMSQDPLAPLAPYLVPLANGILNVETGELGPHDPAVGNRWVLPVEHVVGAPCPTWQEFLRQAVRNPEEVDFIQEWVGYCLIPGNPFERILWLYGPSGTGKSTFVKVVARLFGPSAVAVRADNLDDYTIATLSNCRVALCSEISNRVLRTQVLKQMISGDPVRARHPYGRPFSFRFPGKFIWASNSLPPVDQAEGMWRRLVIPVFERKPAAVDQDLEQKLVAELPGILQWAVGGLVRYREKAAAGRWHDLPASMSGMVEEYRATADVFARFVRDEVQLWEATTPEEDQIPVSEADLYGRFTYWCKDRGMVPEPMGTVFIREMVRNGLQHTEKADKRGRVRHYWVGGSLVAQEM